LNALKNYISGNTKKLITTFLIDITKHQKDIHSLDNHDRSFKLGSHIMFPYTFSAFQSIINFQHFKAAFLAFQSIFKQLILVSLPHHISLRIFNISKHFFPNRETNKEIMFKKG